MSSTAQAAPLAPNKLTGAIRALAMDAVEKAKSGHPGMPMGMADIAEVLWRHHLHHNPANPHWPNRDRFVLSNGHGSMLLYALLHLTGYDLSIEDIKQFRQWHSKTPGHPEYGYAAGIETTTGPLGQGMANAVGMALAEKQLAREFNRPGHEIVDHHTYVFLGDGCMMEGISHEACSLAGTWGLSKLVAFWDDNGISIDGHVDAWFADDTPKRFEAYGWQVIRDVDGHDSAAVDNALSRAHEEHSRPTLICCKTVIGRGAPKKQGSHEAHGSLLGADEIAAARVNLGWEYPPFEIPQDVYDAWNARDKGAADEADWRQKFAAYAAAFPELAAEFTRRGGGNSTATELPADWPQHVASVLAKINEKAETVATRKASQNAIEALAPKLPEFLGGSADLTGSNLTNWSGSTSWSRDGGNYIHYGVREFGMAAIMSGITLHGGYIPYGGTFLTFSDYSRNALRMAALMRIRVIHVFTHDSIGLGEDGPTHQPIEHYAALRLIPNMTLWRPCDTLETAIAWVAAVERKTGPTLLSLSRQNLAFVKRDAATIANIARGGYVIAESNGPARAVLIATGSEVELALKAQAALAEGGIAVRVVSMPCTSVFDAQDQTYRDSVLPHGIVRIAIEVGVPDYWRKYVGLEGAVVGLDHFGESAPAATLFKEFGFTVENVVGVVKSVL